MSRSISIREFPDLSHHAFQHPLDSMALEVLQKVPLLPQILRWMSEQFNERHLRIEMTSSAVRVSEKQYPTLFRQYVRMAKILDIKRLPDLFVRTNHDVNAMAIGQEQYFIVVNSGIMDVMSSDEVCAIIGHELGHVKCDHMLYNNMVYLLSTFGTELLDMILPGIGKMATFGFQYALLEWRRKAEYSADRAALLATQNRESVRAALAKLAGAAKGLPEPLNVDAVQQQAAEYHEIGADSTFSKFFKLWVMLHETHPFPVVRVDEISKWAGSEQYSRLLRGEYRKLSDVAPESRKLQIPTGLTCPKCAVVSPIGSAFCGACGNNLRTVQAHCGNCKNRIEPGWVACPSCGSALRKT